MSSISPGNSARIHRRQFLRTVGLVGAATIGLGAADPTDAIAFTLAELEKGLHEVGASTAKFNISIGSGLASDTTGEANIALGAYSLLENTSGTGNRAQLQQTVHRQLGNNRTPCFW